jgi:glycosyltransferase involved in cell wall biosynthesis
VVNNKGPFVSVIIPYYNRKHLLDQTLKSVEVARRSSQFGIEVLVVDDGSTVNYSKSIQQEFPWVSYIHQENRGAPSARNKGLRKSTGKYILYLDSDDQIEHDFIDPKVKLLEENTEVTGAYGPFDYFSSQDTFNEATVFPRQKAYPIIEQEDYLTHLQHVLGGWYIPCNAILWRKEILVGIGGQNESLMIGQDVDLLFRILVKKNNIRGVMSGRALVRSHDGDRVGVLGDNQTKLEQVFQLRRTFRDEIIHHELGTPENKESLARNCFGFWVKYKKKFPELAYKFLELSNELYPDLNVRGHWYYEWLGKMTGKENAVKLKESINTFLNTFKII